MLTPVNDAAAEDDETVIVTLSASTLTPPNYQIGAPDGGTITIVSDEKPSGLPVAAPGPITDPFPPVASTASPSSPFAATATSPARLTKAELKRQQRIEKARQRAAQKEAKRALKQARRNGEATPSGAGAAFVAGRGDSAGVACRDDAGFAGISTAARLIDRGGEPGPGTARDVSARSDQSAFLPIGSPKLNSSCSFSEVMPATILQIVLNLIGLRRPP